jgi:beta-lactamase regulating signal transducer with metallopeptidase domain
MFVTSIAKLVEAQSQFMFALRGLAVSLSIFLLLYCLLSACTSIGWSYLKIDKVAEQRRANVLFAVRMSPVLVSAIFTVLLIVPSFQILEPRSAGEGMGIAPIMLSIFTVFVLCLGCYQVASIRKATSLAVSRWLVGVSLRQEEPHPQSISILAARGVPSIVLVGIFKPRVLVSKAAHALLTPAELEVSLRHERYHLRSQDNLKKLLFVFLPFPGMKRLENAWSEAQERAADDAAATDAGSALNLASALVKLARLAPVQPEALCMAGFVTGPVESRVMRLIDSKTVDISAHRRMEVYAWGAAATLCLASGYVAAHYGAALVAAHQLTEWLVR